MPNLDTIDYDEPVQNLIAGLNATGHVTHGPYRKTMVTIHHNGGIFTAQQVLNIWKTRPASAHFDVERDGSVTQFANCYDYTWACADRHGNETSISIEMSNATTAPDWLVNIDTWRSAARLTGWLHANILHGTPRPTRSTVVPHHHWAATACAGPYMDSVWGEFIDACQAAYDAFTGGKTPPEHHKPKPPKKHKKKGDDEIEVDGYFGPATTRLAQKIAGSAVDGVISGQPITIKEGAQVAVTLETCWPTIDYDRSRHPAGSALIMAYQHAAGVKADGYLGPITRRAIQRMAGVKADGLPGFKTVKALQRRLNEGEL